MRTLAAAIVLVSVYHHTEIDFCVIEQSHTFCDNSLRLDVNTPIDLTCQTERRFKNDSWRSAMQLCHFQQSSCLKFYLKSSVRLPFDEYSSLRDACDVCTTFTAKKNPFFSLLFRLFKSNDWPNIDRTTVTLISPHIPMHIWDRSERNCACRVVDTKTTTATTTTSENAKMFVSLCDESHSHSVHTENLYLKIN